jgi:hypothetical protein
MCQIKEESLDINVILKRTNCMEQSPPSEADSYLVKFLAFYGTEGSLLCSQDPAIGPYPESDESSPYPPTLFPYDQFYEKRLCYKSMGYYNACRLHSKITAQGCGNMII